VTRLHTPIASSTALLILAFAAACAHGPSTRSGNESPGPATGCAAPGALCWDFEEGALPAGWTAHRDEFSG
jgi:hypothetical protein